MQESFLTFCKEKKEIMRNMKDILIKNNIPSVSGIIKKDFNLSKLTWFKVGGKAEVFFIPKDKTDRVSFLKKLDKNTPIKILGAGSNILIRDGGIRGVTISLVKNFSTISYLNNKRILVGAGMNCIKLSRYCVLKSLQGLEFFSGIPGTVGGAIRMNAGAYGKETSDILEKIVTVTKQGKIKEYKKEELKMSYRKNSLNKDEIILQALFKCKKGNKRLIQDNINKIREIRQITQPITLKTSGSTFKNPENLQAWKLIKQSGCSNLIKGGVKVSSLHSNFLVNQGIARAEDVEDLGKLIIKKVKKKFGLTLQWEIKIVGTKNKYRKYFNE